MKEGNFAKLDPKLIYCVRRSAASKITDVRPIHGPNFIIDVIVIKYPKTKFDTHFEEM